MINKHGHDIIYYGEWTAIAVKDGCGYVVTTGNNENIDYITLLYEITMCNDDIAQVLHDYSFDKKYFLDDTWKVTCSKCRTICGLGGLFPVVEEIEF